MRALASLLFLASVASALPRNGGAGDAAGQQVVDDDHDAVPEFFFYEDDDAEPVKDEHYFEAKEAPKIRLLPIVHPSTKSESVDRLKPSRRLTSSCVEYVELGYFAIISYNFTYPSVNLDDYKHIDVDYDPDTGLTVGFHSQKAYETAVQHWKGHDYLIFMAKTTGCVDHHLDRCYFLASRLIFSRRDKSITATGEHHPVKELISDFDSKWSYWDPMGAMQSSQAPSPGAPAAPSSTKQRRDGTADSGDATDKLREELREELLEDKSINPVYLDPYASFPDVDQDRDEIFRNAVDSAVGNLTREQLTEGSNTVDSAVGNLTGEQLTEGSNTVDKRSPLGYIKQRIYNATSIKINDTYRLSWIFPSAEAINHAQSWTGNVLRAAGRPVGQLEDALDVGSPWPNSIFLGSFPAENKQPTGNELAGKMAELSNKFGSNRCKSPSKAGLKVGGKTKTGSGISYGLDVFCVDCGSRGNLGLIMGQVTYSVLENKVTQGRMRLDMDVQVGLHLGIVGLIHNQHVRVEQPLFKYGFPAFSYGIVTVGPMIEIAAGAELSAHVSGSILAGGTLRLKGVTSMNFAEKTVKSADFDPAVRTRLELTGALEATASVSLPIKLKLGIDIASHSLAVGVVDRPSLTAAARVERSINLAHGADEFVAESLTCPGIMLSVNLRNALTAAAFFGKSENTLGHLHHFQHPLMQRCLK
ncbi:hypothetical protein DCS_05960 [Drechmeria coniospora]|uniref:Uncharacterized protein n=1 Tax=Drechmeria coniospora TaxID=98403 RepID=A0A151GA99_DRECN|nr:hypothetical protein DCS_05960 [Drechmeria coniospora]KYK54010.1 hypothetical protein DCS_05960 [Drechmeria coniospora]